jgi:uncharacterized SAM-dependent methyltransferase
MSISPLRSAQLTEQDDDITDDLREILTGLGQSQKAISSKYFYDEMGSRLFDQICELPEYYLTRTELGILREHAVEMAASIGQQASLTGRHISRLPRHGGRGNRPGFSRD